MYGEGDSAVSDMGILQGDGVRIHCPRAGCLHTSHTVLELCDHINTDHQAQRAVLVQRLTGLKTCPCGALYVDTQVGKSAHHAWCDALAERLASSAPMLESALGSVVIQQITGISTVASDGTVVRLKAHALTAHDWGSTGSLHGVNHTNICFYLCCEAPATLPAAGSIAPVDMRERAIRRKQRLAPGATAIVIAANRQGADFGRADVMADTEVSIETARGGEQSSLWTQTSFRPPPCSWPTPGPTPPHRSRCCSGAGTTSRGCMPTSPSRSTRRVSCSAQTTCASVR